MFWKQGLAYATCSEYLHFLVLASLLKLESPNCTPTLLAHHQCKILPFQVLTCKKRWNFLQNICFKRKAKEKLFLKCTIVNIFCKHHQLWTRRYVCWFIQLDCKKYKWSSFDLLHYLTFDITRQILDSPLNRVIGERNCGKLIFCISSQHYVSYFQNARLHWSFPNTPIVCGFFCFAISNATK